MTILVKRWLRWLPLAAIIVAGTGLRLYQIGALPPGLYRDEAFYGLDALAVLRGHFAVYFAANNGREGLFMYLLAAGIAFLGRTPEALRIVSALVGSLTIVAIYAVGRALFSHRIGVLSAAILAITFWHLALSRVAFRAITLPLLLCLTVCCGAVMLKAINRPANGDQGGRTRQIAISIAAGLCFGLTFYTYTSASFLLALIVAFGVVCALLNALHVNGYRLPRSPRSPAARTLLSIFAVAALVVLAPYLIWLFRHPEMVFARAEQVSILNPVINKGDFLGALWQDIVKAAGMFAYQGDRIWRHNESLRPVFDGGIATAFFAGVAVCLWRIFVGKGSIKPASLFVGLWLVFFLIPTILAEDTPHYLRAIGALPAACIIAALGLEAVLAWLSRRGLLNLPIGGLRRIFSPPALIAAVLLVWTGYGTAADYFNHYVRDAMTAYWLEDSNVQLASAINAYTTSNAPESLWLQDRLANDNPALRFLSPTVEENRVSIVNDAKPGLGGSSVLLLVDPNHDWTRLRAALPALSQISVTAGPLAQNDLDLAPRRAFIAVSAQPLAAPMSLTTSGMPTFGGAIGLNSAHIESTEQGRTPRIFNSFPHTETAQSSYTGAMQVYTITLAWSATAPITEDYAVFVHWQRNGVVLTQNDSTPAQGYMPMPTWRLGDVIMDTHILTVAGGLQTGDEVDVGVYRRSDNMRLQTRGGLSATSATPAPNEPDAVKVLSAVER